MLAHQVSTVSELFRKRVEVAGDAVAWSVKVDGRWRPTTWGVLAERVDRVAAGLVGAGLGHGDTVAVLGGCVPEWVVVDVAALCVGGITVGIYENLLADQIRYILDDAGARVLFVQGAEALARVMPLLDAVQTLDHIVVWDAPAPDHPAVTELEAFAHAEAVAAHRDEAVRRERAIAPDDTAIVVYTSGTTGNPKGVPLGHGLIVEWLRATQGTLADDITDDDLTISFLPMAHVAEHVAGLFGRMNLGLRTCYASGYDTLLDEIAEVRPTYFGAVPRIFEKMYGRIRERVAASNPRRQALFRWADRLARARSATRRGGPPLTPWQRVQLRVADRLVFRRIRDVFGGRVKYFLTGSAPVDLEILEFFDGAGMTILEVYGLSESCAIAFANTVDDHRIGTVGKAVPGVEARLAPDGEILLRGPTIFPGYLGLQEANAAAFDADGFFRTGDIGAFDADGYLRITDRKKNLIKTAGGKYVVPARIEALVKEEPSVSQVYVHGDRRPYVVALITLDEREVPRLAEELGVAATAVPAHPEVRRRVDAAVARANTRLARFEQVKRFEVLPEDFSIETGTVTPTLKIKRKAVAARYADALEQLYA